MVGSPWAGHSAATWHILGWVLAALCIPSPILVTELSPDPASGTASHFFPNCPSQLQPVVLVGQPVTHLLSGPARVGGASLANQRTKALFLSCWGMPVRAVKGRKRFIEFCF